MKREEKKGLPFFGIPKLAPYLKPYRMLFFWMVTMGGIGSAMDAVIPLFQQHAIDHFIAEKTMDGIGGFLALYILVMLVQTATNYISAYGACKVELYIGRDLKREAFNHLQTLSFSYFNQNSVGYIHARVMSDTDRIASTLAWGLMEGVWYIAYLLFAVVMMFVLNWHLALCVMVIVPVLVVSGAYFQKKLVFFHRRVREQNSRITGAFNEGITGAKTTKTLVIEDKVEREFDGLTGKMKRMSVRAMHFRSVFMSTTAFAASSFSLIADFMASSAPETADLIPSQIESTVSLQFSQISRKGRVMIWKAALIISFTAMIPTCTTFLIVSHAPDRNEVIPFQIPEKNDEITVQPVVKMLLIQLRALLTVEVIPLQIPEKNETIPFQIPSKKLLTELHASSQLEPNQPSTVSASLLNVSIQFVKVFTTKSQTPPKISLTPSQTRSQSPVKIPANTSKSPTSTSSTAPRMLLICWNTPSNTGASSSQKPFQTALSTSVKFSKSKPSSLSLSVMVWPNASNFPLIPSQIAVILFLNSSLFLHRFVKARARAATAAITASTGADIPPRATITPCRAPFTMVSF